MSPSFAGYFNALIRSATALSSFHGVMISHKRTTASEQCSKYPGNALAAVSTSLQPVTDFCIDV